MKRILAIMLMIAMLVTLNMGVYAAESANYDDEHEISLFANDQYVYNREVYMEDYSDLFTLSGSKLTSYYSVGASSEIKYVTINIYRETAPSATGRTLIARKRVATGTSSTLFFRDKSIVAGAKYRVHVVTDPVSTSSSPTKVVVSLVSW